MCQTATVRRNTPQTSQLSPSCTPPSRLHVLEQAMVADVDAERAEEVEADDGPGQPGPAEQPGDAGEQRQQVEADDPEADARVDALGARGIEDAEPPEAAVENGVPGEHLDCLH